MKVLDIENPSSAREPPYSAQGCPTGEWRTEGSVKHKNLKGSVSLWGVSPKFYLGEWRVFIDTRSKVLRGVGSV